MLRQLSSLAALHVRIGHGQPAAFETLGALEALLPSPALDVHTCMQSPAGDCAVVIWELTRKDEDQLVMTMTVGALVCGRSADGVVWSSLQPSTLHFQPFYKFLAAFSQDGRFCVTVFETGTHTETKMGADTRTEYLDPEDPDAPRLVARFFITQHRVWLSELLIHVCSGLAGGAELSVSSTRGHVVAALQVSQSGEDDALLVLEAFPPRSEVIITGDVRTMLWLPHTNSLIFLTRPYPSAPPPVPPHQGLARLDVLAELPSPASLAWVSLPAASQLSSGSLLATDPDGMALWLLHTRTAAAGLHGICLSVYCAADLTHHGSWQLDAVLGVQEDLEMQVTYRAVAISCVPSESTPVEQRGASRSFVYQLLGHMLLGPLLFSTEHLTDLAFSADGSFLVGKYRQDSIRVLQVSTGACAATFQPPVPDSPWCRVLDVAWSACHAGQLLLTYCDSDGQHMCRVQF